MNQDVDHDGIRFGGLKAEYLGSEGWRRKEGMWGDLTRNRRTLGHLLHSRPCSGRPGEVSCVQKDLEFSRY